MTVGGYNVQDIAAADQPEEPRLLWRDWSPTWNDVDAQFTGPFRSVLLRRVGHNPPQEQPESFAAAVRSLLPS